MAMRTTVVTFVAALALTACASSVPKPTDKVSDATRAMERASQVNAHEFAAFEMATAERKLNRARNLANSDKDEDRRDAARLADQVTADARLAEAKARLASAESVNAEAKETLEALRKETEQDAGGTP